MPADSPSFSQVFDTIGEAADKAAVAQRSPHAVLDEPMVLQHASAQGEVDVEITDNRISRLALAPDWLELAPAEQVEKLITDTLNDAYRQYAVAAMERLTSATPSLAEVQDVVSKARQQLRGAFDAEMARIREAGEPR